MNLTDGLDGLAAGASAIVLVAMAGIAFIIGRNTSDPGITDLMVIAGCVGGAALGFLWYNTFPADVFMGDTGSLGLGGAIAGMAVMTPPSSCRRSSAACSRSRPARSPPRSSPSSSSTAACCSWRRCTTTSSSKRGPKRKIIVRFWIIAAIFAGAGFAAYYATF